MTYRILGDILSIEGHDYLILRNFTYSFTVNDIRNVYIVNDNLIDGNARMSKFYCLLIIQLSLLCTSGCKTTQVK